MVEMVISGTFEPGLWTSETVDKMKDQLVLLDSKSRWALMHESFLNVHEAMRMTTFLG